MKGEWEIFIKCLPENANKTWYEPLQKVSKKKMLAGTCAITSIRDFLASKLINFNLKSDKALSVVCLWVWYWFSICEITLKHVQGAFCVPSTLRNRRTSICVSLMDFFLVRIFFKGVKSFKNLIKYFKN